MKIGELIGSHRLILCTCYDCGGRTPIDPSLPARTFGRSVDLEDLRTHLNCPVCGSADVDIGAYAPVHDSEEMSAHAK